MVIILGMNGPLQNRVNIVISIILGVLLSWMYL